MSTTFQPELLFKERKAFLRRREKKRGRLEVLGVLRPRGLDEEFEHALAVHRPQATSSAELAPLMDPVSEYGKKPRLHCQISGKYGARQCVCHACSNVFMVGWLRVVAARSRTITSDRHGGDRLPRTGRRCSRTVCPSSLLMYYSRS